MHTFHVWSINRSDLHFSTLQRNYSCKAEPHDATAWIIGSLSYVKVFSIQVTVVTIVKPPGTPKPPGTVNVAVILVLVPGREPLVAEMHPL